jgi:membrane protein implicated in regulation of membrane protease activity
MKFLAIALALAFFAVGVLYWLGRLQIGAGHAGPHHAHGVLFLALGVLSLLWARFQAGEQNPSGARTGS